jgi:hypothetical protein
VLEQIGITVSSRTWPSLRSSTAST